MNDHVSHAERMAVFERYLALAYPQMPESLLHGEKHWRQVAENAERLASVTPGANWTVIAAFAALHDSQRRSEHGEPEHGLEAAQMVFEELPGLTEDERMTLAYALSAHDKGFTTTDPTVGVAWDADRLDLPRVGVVTNPALMSTEAGRQAALDRINWTPVGSKR